MKEGVYMKGLRKIKEDNKGVGVVEIILILVVLIALVVIFQEQITSLVNIIWKSINSGAKEIL